MEWLPREEELILLSALAGRALLVLGILEAVWPTRSRRASRPARAVPARMTPPEDPDPASDQRVRLLCRAIACLDRGLGAAPNDARLGETLAAAHEALAKTDEQTALKRLAAEMPWRGPTLALALVGPR